MIANRCFHEWRCEPISGTRQTFACPECGAVMLADRRWTGMMEPGESVWEFRLSDTGHYQESALSV